MPDWLELVRQRLSGLALDSKEKEEVHLELAAHLEESYETFRSKGLADHEAVRRTLAESGCWKDLQRKIDSARSGKDTMTNRVKQLWLPSLATLIVSMILLPVLGWLGLNPHFFFLRGPHDRAYVFPIYTAWLLLLPFVGALGAYLSNRAGGTKRAVVISGIFPAFAFFAVLLLVIPFMGILEHGLDAGPRSVFDSLTSEPFGRLGVLAGWVLVPGTCLWIGVQACLFISRRLTPRGVATN